MRQTLSDKKIRQLAHETGLHVMYATVRGGTDHRIDLYIDGGSIVARHKQGHIVPLPHATWQPRT